MYRLRLIGGVGTLLLGVALVVSLHAQGPSLTLPNGSVYKAGPDFATDVLQDPWDFSNPQDVSQDPDEFSGWSAPTSEAIRTFGPGAAFLSGGRFVGTPGGVDTKLYLLRHADRWMLNPGRSGIRDPIDTSRYGKLAVKMRVENAAPADLTAFWFHAPRGEDWTTRFGGAVVPPLVSSDPSERVYTLDLSGVVPQAGPAPYLNEPLVRGLRLDLDPSAGQHIAIDWVRLTTPDLHNEAARMPVNLFGCTGLQSMTVTDASNIQTVIQGGDIIGSGDARQFNYGIFPPGRYDIFASCGNGTTGRQPFEINTPPQVTVVDPDEAGDPATDYATTVRNDPWDFEQLTDVAASGNVTLTGGACPQVGCGLVAADPSGHMLRASAHIDNGDPQITMVDSAIVPLNSRKHHILRFSLRNLRPYFGNEVFGPALRLFWGSAATPDGNNITTTQEIAALPGFTTYTIDLASLTIANGGIETECGPSCLPWTARGIRHFRIDPHEYSDAPTAFDLDSVTLTAPDSVALGQTFAVRYSFDDPDGSGSTYTAHIFRADWATRANPVLLASLPGVTPGVVHTYTLDPAARGIPAGRYAIVVRVDEARTAAGSAFTQMSTAYAQGALVVSDPSASTPRISVASPVPGQNVPAPFAIQGCAYDDGPGAQPGSINVDDVAVNMRAVAGPRTGMTLPLGFHPTIPHTGVLEVGVACPGAPGPFANAGFRITNIGGGINPPSWLNGTWEIDVYARSTISGEVIQLAPITVQIGPVPPPAPENFQASAAGNTVTVSWQPPPGGAASYQIQGSLDPSFASLAFSINVPGTGPYSGQLGSGRYYLRVYARSASGVWSSPSLTRQVDVALPTSPGAPTLVATQVSANPVTINWSPGPGGPPAAYTIHAGTSPGASNLLIAPMGLATGVTAVAPVGVPLYVRVVASNGAGHAVSNEISFVLAPPNPPTLNPAVVTGNAVALSWTPPTGGVPASYTILARDPSSAAIIARLPAGGTAVTVNAVPPGTYVVTMVSHNGQGTSAESNAITVNVP